MPHVTLAPHPHPPLTLGDSQLPAGEEGSLGSLVWCGYQAVTLLSLPSRAPFPPGGSDRWEF